MTVTVIQAQQLPAMDLGGRCDSYVKVRLLPAKKPTHKTEVLYNTCNPLFQETFAFEVALRIRFRDEILRWTASRKRAYNGIMRSLNVVLHIVPRVLAFP